MTAYTADMLIQDALMAGPDAVSVFERHGLPCAHCLAAEIETLASVATMHEIPLKPLLADLNALTAPTQGGLVDG